MVTINHLPPDVLYDISDYVSSGSLAALARTSRHFYSILNPHLYIKDIHYVDADYACLFWAAKHGRLDTIKMAHSYGADLNFNRATTIAPPTPLHTAIKYLRPAVVEYIAQNGGELESPAWMSSAARPLPLGKALLARKIQPGGPGKMDAIAKILIRHGATMVDEGEPALPRVASLNKMEMIKMLLEQPSVGVNDATGTGMTALHMAAAKGHLELTRFLLQQPGIDVRAETSDGWDALRLAAREGHLSVARLLVSMTREEGPASRERLESWVRAHDEAARARRFDVCHYLSNLPEMEGRVVYVDGHQMEAG